MIYTEWTKKAMKLAYKAHHGQVDKGGMPYVFHPFHLAEQMDDEISTVAALLHDVVEDTDWTLEALAAGSSPLTDREADVLREVEGGGTIADIAHSLHLSQGTVRNHVSSAMLKMDARTRAEAASLARAAGWL